jgi:phospholipid/cholesterol/gamma-HCH transport system substrate-binding protein
MRPGSPEQPLLQDGDEITIVLRQPGVNEVFNQMNKIAADISEVTGNLRKVLGSQEGEENLHAILSNLARLSRTLDQTVTRSSGQLDNILTNFQSFSSDVSTLTRTEQGDIVAILQNTRDATAEARDVLRTIGGMVGAHDKGELKDGAAGLKGSLDKLDKTLANVESISKKIDAGQGTIGHLVNDDKLGKDLDKAAKSLSNLFGAADSLRIELFERSEFLVGRFNPSSSNPGANTSYNPWAKNYFGIKIQPKPDKWYGAELVDDPRGVTRLVRTTNADFAGQPINSPFFPANLSQITNERTLKFSVYIAKRYGPVSGRFGILENTGGFGGKVYFLNDQLTFSLDAFEFSNPLTSHPRLKAYVDYRFWDHLLITAGADDFINRTVSDPVDVSRIIRGRDYFIGAGFYFTDEDLKQIFAAVPVRF